MEKYNYMYVRPANFGTGFDVIGVGTHQRGSVLEGQDRICFVDSFETVEMCEEKYPACKGSFNNAFTEPRNTYQHLSINGDGW